MILKCQLNSSLLYYYHILLNYTHTTENNQTNSWDNQGMEPIENDHEQSKEQKTPSTVVPSEAQNAKKKHRLF